MKFFQKSSKLILHRFRLISSLRSQKIIDRKLRAPDFEGFRDSLAKNDRVPAWLKFTDICMSEEKHSLTRENFLDLLKTLGPAQINSSLMVIETMKEMDHEIDSEAVNLVLLNMAKNSDYLQITNFLVSIKQKGIPITTSSYNIILRMYFKKSVEAALSIASKMTQESISLDQESYSILISGCSNADRYDLAEKFVVAMNESNIQPDSKTFTELIRMYYKKGDLESADKCFENAKALGVLDDYLYSAVLFGCHKSGLNEKFDDTVHFMQANHKVESLIVLTTIIQNYLSRGLINEAFVILKQMESSKVLPDITLNVAIVSGCCDIGQSDLAFNYLQELQTKNQPITLKMYRIILEGLLKEKKFDKVFAVYDMIKNKKLITPMYNIVLKAASSILDLEMFQKVWKELLNSAFCNPNEVSYVTAFEMYTNVRQVSEAKKMYVILRNLQFEVPKDVVLDLISGAIQSRMYTDAAEVISMLRKSGKHDDLKELLTPHVPGFKELVITLGKELKVNSDDRKICFLILDVYKEVLEFQENQDEQVLQIVMEANRLVKDLVSVVKVWSKLEKCCANPSPESLSCLLRAGIELGHAKTATALINMTRDEKYTLDRKCYENLLVLYCKFTDGKEVPALLIDMINNDIGIDSRTWKLVKTAFVERKAKELKDAQSDEAYGYVYRFFEEQFPEIIDFDGVEVEMQVQQAQQDRI